MIIDWKLQKRQKIWGLIKETCFQQKCIHEIKRLEQRPYTHVNNSHALAKSHLVKNIISNFWLSLTQSSPKIFFCANSGLEKDVPQSIKLVSLIRIRVVIGLSCCTMVVTSLKQLNTSLFTIFHRLSLFSNASSWFTMVFIIFQHYFNGFGYFHVLFMIFNNFKLL